MDYQQDLDRAKKNALIMFVVAVFCLELALLFLSLAFYKFVFSTIAVAAFALLFVFVPVGAVLEWKKEVRKSKDFSVTVRSYSLPFSSKVKMLGAQLTLTDEAIIWKDKQNYDNREVAYGDIEGAEVHWSGAFVLKLTRRSHKLSLKINLSLCSREDWPLIVDAIAVKAPQAHLNNLALAIREGKVPYFS